MNLLMSRPDFYDIEYEINPWMHLNQQVNTHKALQQWHELYQTLKKCGAKIDLVKQVPGCPDMVFTANAGLCIDGKILLSNFKYKERQAEVPYYEQWFIENNYSIIPFSNKEYFEGEGDALFAGKKLFLGYGFRSSKNYYENNSIFINRETIFCELINPYFYHLDTCFCPLSPELALWYPEAFSDKSRKEMTKHIELIAVENDEAKRFACNAVVLNKQIVLPSECPKISNVLESYGYSTHPCEIDEYIKAGGACKCLVMRIGHF